MTAEATRSGKRWAGSRDMLQHAAAIGAVEEAEEKYCLLNELLLQEVRAVEAARKVIETAAAEWAKRRPFRMLRNGWARKLSNAPRLAKQAGPAGFANTGHPLFCEAGGLQSILLRALRAGGE